MHEAFQHDFETGRWSGRIGFALHGVSFGIRFDDAAAGEVVRRIVPRAALPSDYLSSEHRFSLISAGGDGANGLFFDTRDFESVLKFDRLDGGTEKGLETKFQFALALAAAPRLFFLHAGAVAIGNIGVLVLGRTGSGKTTLVGELLRRGADLCTDDCAILDPAGNLYPNPAPLAVRTGDGRAFRGPEEYGSIAASRVVPVALVVAARYERGAVWAPEAEASGGGAFNVLGNLFYPPAIREFPRETLGFAGLIAKRGIYSGTRGEATEVAEWIFGTIGRGHG